MLQYFVLGLLWNCFKLDNGAHQYSDLGDYWSNSSGALCHILSFLSMQRARRL